jgi:hypothetical protein
MTAEKTGEGTMGRPPIGDKVMTSSERAQRYRNKKRRRAQRIREAPWLQREWLLMEMAVREPTRGIIEKLVRTYWAVLKGVPDGDIEEVVKCWDIIAEHLCETMREVSARQ